MKKELERRKQNFEVSQREKEKSKIITGQVKDIVETEFLDTMLKNKKVVCHFYHKDFERCKIMEKHLQIVASTHGETMFVRIDAEKTPFFTGKLNIKVSLL
jgi:thioredoxin-like negative regulator of GroEL